MNYLFRKVGYTYVVWLAEANRFVQLQEPAFRVLESWTNGTAVEQMALHCVYEYQLSLSNARRFVLDLIRNFQEIIDLHSNRLVPADRVEPVVTDVLATTRQRFYRVHEQVYRFTFASQDLEDLIHPRFEFLEVSGIPEAIHHQFDIFDHEKELILNVDQTTIYRCETGNEEQLAGMIYVQWLNGIYQTNTDFWMGSVHASTVAGRDGAVMFAAPSGSGKSTFAALLKFQGYRVLTDDFSPISLSQSRVYPFPEGISIKERSAKLLAWYFPELEKAVAGRPEKAESVLPVSISLTPEPVKAIVFLSYDSSVELEFRKRTNLEAMDDLLKQLWLPARNEVAQSFLNWFFEIPCYTLRYSNTRKAIQCVESLLRK